MIFKSSDKDYGKALVARFNAGDGRAFDEIVVRYREMVFRRAYHLIRNWEDAEEITMDTFIRAHRGLATFRGDSAIHTWLFQIVTNLSYNRYWYWFRRMRDRSVSFEAPVNGQDEITLAEVIPVQDSDIRDLVETSELVDVVARSMERLDDKHREILILRNVQHLAYEEIGQVLGIGLGTVKSRITRARENLRKFILVDSRKEVAL